MIGILAAKLLVVLGVTVASAVGVWAPLYMSRPRRQLTSLSTLSSNHGEALSLCNCLSAGMLLANALGHFFPDAFDGGCTRAAASHHSFWLLVGILFPAILNRLCPVTHTHGGHSPAPPPSSGNALASVLISNALMLLLLMCFHFATEGVLISVEASSTALAALAIPLSIHRFFDGVVVGVSLAKEREELQRADPLYMRSPDDEVTTDRRSTFTAELPSTLYASLPATHRIAIVLWLLVTPIAFVVAEISQSHAHGHDNSRSGDASSAHSHSDTSNMAAVKAFGSGSFIFIALELLAEEDMRGIRPTVTMLLGTCFTLLLLLISPEEGH